MGRGVGWGRPGGRGGMHACAHAAHRAPRPGGGPACSGQLLAVVKTACRPALAPPHYAAALLPTLTRWRRWRRRACCWWSMGSWRARWRRAHRCCAAARPQLPRRCGASCRRPSTIAPTVCVNPCWRPGCCVVGADACGGMRQRLEVQRRRRPGGGKGTLAAQMRIARSLQFSLRPCS